MPIHEKSLIDPKHLRTADKLVLDGIDVSGHWNTMITPRTLTDYDPELQEAIRKLPGGELVERCWQCGSCTNACTMYALNTDFNPRYWIYCINLGLQSEIVKDKDIIWQCVSCNKCTNICPKYVNPEGVMKALQHWLEDEGHVPRSNPGKFDDEFARQCLERGRIEEGSILLNYFKAAGENVAELVKRGWLGLFGQRAANLPLLQAGRVGAFLARLPVFGPLRMAWHFAFKPRVRSWEKTGAVLRQYLKEQGHG